MNISGGPDTMVRVQQKYGCLVKIVMLKVLCQNGVDGNDKRKGSDYRQHGSNDNIVIGM